MRCLPPTAGRVSDKPKIFIIPKNSALSETFGLCSLQQFSGYFAAGLLGRFALNRITLCKDECLAATKASEKLFCAICSALLTRDRLTHWKCECLSATKAPENFCSFAFILLRPIWLVIG